MGLPDTCLEPSDFGSRAQGIISRDVGKGWIQYVPACVHFVSIPVHVYKFLNIFDRDVLKNVDCFRLSTWIFTHHCNF